MSDKYDDIRSNLEMLYGKEAAPALVEQIRTLIKEAHIEPRPVETWSEKDVLCITYADSILGAGTPLETLHKFFAEHVGPLINTIHILPFYPYSSDDGFSVMDYEEVREDLGSWNHIFAMAQNHRLVFDCVVNHVSARSRYMKAYAEGHPDYENFFIEMQPDADVSKVTRPRTLPLLHEYETHKGRTWLWTTFSDDQVDLNFKNPRVLLEMVRVMLSYAARGASMLRLDAIPYVWKKPGTTCIHLEEAHVLVKLFRDIYDAAAPHVRLLSETNVPHEENLAYFGDELDEADMIYNFTLAPLILWSIVKGNCTVLADWASRLEVIAPHATYLNITATHDGIGVRPTEGILTSAERDELAMRVYEHGGMMSSKTNPDGTTSPYELNISYFDALTHPESNEPTTLQVARFLVSQAIPMALLGVPGIYIHSLLGSRSDLEGVEKTGRFRSINRAQLRIDDLEKELADPSSVRGQVFNGIKRLLAIRTANTAFSPHAPQEIHRFSPHVFAVLRRNYETGQSVLALHNVTDTPQTLEFGDLLAGDATDLVTGNAHAGTEITLAPYQVAWLASNTAPA